MRPMPIDDAKGLSDKLVNSTNVLPEGDGLALLLEEMEDGTLRVWDDDAAYRYQSRKAFDAGEPWLWVTGRGNIIASRSGQ